MFEAHLTVWACALALLKAGNSIAARIAIMAITTSNSINVKPAEQRRPAVAFGEFEGGSFILGLSRGAPQRQRTDPAGVVFFDPPVAVDDRALLFAVKLVVHAVPGNRLDQPAFFAVVIGVFVPAR